MTKLEKDLMDLAELLGVGTHNSDICLRAIGKIQALEDEVAHKAAKLSDMAWERDGGDRMGGSFSAWELNRRGDEWS